MHGSYQLCGLFSYNIFFDSGSWEGPIWSLCQGAHGGSSQTCLHFVAQGILPVHPFLLSTVRFLVSSHFVSSITCLPSLDIPSMFQQSVSYIQFDHVAILLLHGNLGKYMPAFQERELNIPIQNYIVRSSS